MRDIVGMFAVYGPVLRVCWDVMRAEMGRSLTKVPSKVSQRGKQVKMAGKKKFYFNTRTGKVEEGKRFSWVSRLGPYSSRQEAQNALDTAAERTEAWDEADRAEQMKRDGE